MKIMQRMLEYVTFKRDAGKDDVCSKALDLICRKLRSVTAAKLLLTQKDIDLSADRGGLESGSTMHALMDNISSANIFTATQVLSNLLNYPQLGDAIYKLDGDGLSVLDRFIVNNKLHCFDLDLSEKARPMLDMLIRIKGIYSLFW